MECYSLGWIYFDFLRKAMFDAFGCGEIFVFLTKLSVFGLCF
jgi:hypothetical protein